MPALPDDVLDSAASAALERSDRTLPAPEALADVMEVSVVQVELQLTAARHITLQGQAG